MAHSGPRRAISESRRLASQVTGTCSNGGGAGGGDHIEKHDDRVVAFATRLSAGRHEISYLARATTSGTFETHGTWGEALYLYAPEITGRAAPTTVVVR